MSSLSRQVTPETPGTSSISTPTTSPNEFFSLDPCSHLAQVLNSNAKDTALRNYGLAVKVIKFSKTSPRNLSNLQQKDPKSKPVDRSRLMRLRSKVLKCKDCYVNVGNTYICLQCPQVGCFKNRHFVNHAKMAGHIFGIDSQTGYLYCFKCGNYTNDVHLEAIRQFNTKKLPQPLAISTTGDYEGKNLISEYSRPTSFKSTTGVRGFVNMGSTCFMSSIIQTFVHNPIIRDYFMTVGHMYCPKDKADCITCALDEIFTSFYTSNKTSGFGPVSLLNAAWKINKSLAGYSEQDAHEFWQFLVNQLHQDLIDKTKDLSLSLKQGTDHVEGDSCSCIVHKTFSSDLQSSITCLQCGNVTDTVDPVIDFSLGIKHSDNLHQCFKHFTQDEKLDVKYNCSKCKERTSVRKRLSILKLPNVLAIQLKRFEHTSASVKLENFIKFPMFLNMSEFSTSYQTSGEIDPTLNYELFAIICHIGSVNTGHYIAVIKNNKGEWFKFDDSVVTLITNEQVSKLTAYLLFYVINKLA